MEPRQIAVIMVVALMPLVPATVSAARKNDMAVTSDKKPGKTCDNLAHRSDAHKQCIQTQAHTGQEPKKP